MPVNGLPLTVENALSGLLVEGSISSWKITGGEKYAVLTLRFAMADHDQTGENCGQVKQSTVTQFRRKPPSQIKRDSTRRKVWQSSRDSDADKDNSDVESVFSDNVTLVKTPPVVNSTNVPSSSEVISPGPELGSQPGGTLETDMPTLTHLPIMQNTNNIIPQSTDHKQCKSCKSNLPKPGENRWIKCTEEGCDICVLCHDRGRHDCFSHQDQLQEFTPPDPNCQSYCDGCGLEFRSHLNKYYMCNICENYTLCRLCHRKTLHRIIHHSDMGYIAKSKHLKSMSADTATTDSDV